MQMLGHSQHRHIPVVQLYWITQTFCFHCWSDAGYFSVICFCCYGLHGSSWRGIKSLPCAAKKENTNLERFVFGTNGSCLFNSASGQADTQLQQEVSSKRQTRLGSGSRVKLPGIFRKQIPIWAVSLCHEITSHEFQSCSRELHCLWSAFNWIVVSFAFNVFKRAKLQWVSANLPGTRQKWE